ncbi:uncharacterized protein LOC144450926 [Glandiceps talaboti]
MGKRDTRVSYMNPVAMARARGPKPAAGPSIQDYLSRPRPTWDEVKVKVQQQRGKPGSSTLAEWEKQMNDKHREELKKYREKILSEPSSKEKDKKKKTKKRKRERSPSSSSPSSRSSSLASQSVEEYTKKRKKKKKKHKHRSRRNSSNERDAGSCEERSWTELHHSEKRKKKKRKHRKHKSKRKHHRGSESD